jgi:Ca2+-transporting ATPase
VSSGGATDPAVGLSAGEVAARLASAGPNEIARREGPSAWAILAGQLRGAMTWLLVAACAISAALGEIVDAVAIGTIVILNALIGFAQEYRAERAMGALRAMTAPRARVRRGGRIETVAAREIVPGDVLVLDAGDIVAADAALIEAHRLTVSEAALTGESMPVDKTTTPSREGAPLAERHDRVFMGTSISDGSALAVVSGTGMGTELGRIASLLAEAKNERTPLEHRLEKVGRLLLLLCLVVASVVAVLGLLRGQPALEVAMSAVSLAVAAVPEGLAAIVTVALAIGVQRMTGRNVLVRKLPAVETLGCTTVICTDKTGTLTTGVMSVRELWGDDHHRVLDVGAACCDAELDDAGARGSGDPTEVAILLAARERGIERAAIERDRPRREVHPFDAERKRMSILRADGVLYVKGAVDLLLPLCVDGTRGALEANEEMAARGLRVLGVATGAGSEERELRLVGLLGLADPPRAEATEAVRRARAAGIRTVMITGDHPVTANAIAREMGIVREGDDPAELVHARATPEDKLRIVRSWKARGEIVAMTGDGVNDAPALREAHIGIAMGKTGTEVSREASAMILTDDDFASIVAAIREGRGIFDNVRKTLVYLLTGNFGELVLMLGASIAGLPLPLTALQILWINLVTDGLPALALVMDPPDRDVLEQPPRRASEPILGPSQWRTVIATGVLEAAVVLATFTWALSERDPVSARSFAFSVLVFAEVLRAFSARSPTRVFFETGVFTNLRLLAVVALTGALQIGLHQLPAIRELFGIVPLTLAETALAVGLGLVPVTAIELFKLATRGMRSRSDGAAAGTVS